MAVRSSVPWSSVWPAYACLDINNKNNNNTNTNNNNDYKTLLKLQYINKGQLMDYCIYVYVIPEQEGEILSMVHVPWFAHQ